MHINTQTHRSVTTWRTLGKVASLTMETKVLVLLLASHCVPATDMTSLIASNYAKVHRTGSFTSTETDRKNNGDMYDDRQKWGSEITTEASDIYNVYYPVMEAQVVTDNNDTHTALHTPLTENPRTATSESSVSVLQLNPLAAFINAFFRQPAYVADNNEETSESSLSPDSTYDEPSSRANTTIIPPTINQSGYSDQPNSYDVESPRLQANGRTAEQMDEGYTELMGVEQDIQYVDSHNYPGPDDKTSSFMRDEYQPTALNESYKQNDPIQPTKLGTYYELNQSYQSALQNSYNLTEFYPPATSSNPYALKESYQPTTSENPYRLNAEEYRSSAPPDEDERQQDSDYDYDSFKRKVSAKQGSTPNSNSTLLTPHKHQTATGREKNPYTYFYVGRKLWYVPLFFSVYFMLYVLALVVRSISRHKIVFPVTKTKYEKRELNSGLEDITHQVTTALETRERVYL